MTFDFDNLSTEFQQFHETFSPTTYGKSMGRAADHAMYTYDGLCDDEKALATEWFLEIFTQETPPLGHPYFWVIEKMNDPRFIPLLKDHFTQLKQRHNRPVKAEMHGEIVTIRPNFSSELKRCKHVIRSLKKAQKKANLHR